MNIELNKKNLQIMSTICKLVKQEFSQALRLSDPRFLLRARYYAGRSRFSNIRVLVYALCQEPAPVLSVPNASQIRITDATDETNGPTPKRNKRVYRGQLVNIES